MSRRSISRVVLTTVAVLILPVLVWWVGVREAVSAVCDAGPGAFIAVGLSLGATLLLRAVAWMIVNHGVGQRVPLKTLLGAEVVGEAGNTVTPARNFGGEPLKVLFVVRSSSYRTDEVAGTMLLTRYLEVLSFVLFVIGCAVIALPVYHDALLGGPSLVSRLAVPAVVGAFLLLFVLLCTSLAKGWRPIARFLTWLWAMGLWKRRMARIVIVVRRMEERASRAFQEQPRVALVVFLTLAGTHLIIMIRPAIFWWLGYGDPLGLLPLCLIFLGSQALMSVPFTPSGIGIVDGGLVGIFLLLGHDKAECVAYLLCLRVCDALVVACGAWLTARVGARLLFRGEPGS